MDYDKLDDLELETLVCGEGEEGAIAVYLRRVVGELVGMAHSTYGLEKHAAEDLISGVLATFCAKRKTLTPGRVRRWLFRTAIHRCLKHHRHRAVMVRAHDEIQATADRYGAFDAFPTKLELNEALEHLQKKDKDLLYHMVMEGKTVEETAREMGMSVRGVETRKMNAIRRLRMILEKAC